MKIRIPKQPLIAFHMKIRLTHGLDRGPATTASDKPASGKLCTFALPYTLLNELLVKAPSNRFFAIEKLQNVCFISRIGINTVLPGKPVSKR